MPIADLAAFTPPHGCRLVGIELMDEAVELPSFTHPPQAAYVLGAERASLSPALVEQCDFVVKIPTRFCVNVAIAGALVMYDRMISLGRFAERPVRAGGPTAARPAPCPWRAGLEAQARQGARLRRQDVRCSRARPRTCAAAAC